MDHQRIEALLEKVAGLKVAVVGDLMLDRYIWGKASRISQEAPVPVVRVERESTEPGGGANVLRNLASLGAHPLAFGVVGDDASGRILTQRLDELGCQSEGVLTDPRTRTTEKTRVIAGNQQVVRVDVEETSPVSPEIEEALLEKLGDACGQGGVDAIIVEDYAKGTVSKSLLEGVAALGRERGVPVSLDPHPANPYNVGGLTLMTPNRTEAFALAGAYSGEASAEVLEDSALLKVAETLETLWGPQYLLVTLGARGMVLFKEGQPALHVPTRGREVFDVSGAGDTVIATYTLALTAGASPEEAAIVANHAAGIVIAKVGTAPVYPQELIESFREDAP